MTTDLSWIESARSRLLSLRQGDGAWSYRAGPPSAVEPSALASLALLAAASSEARTIALRAGHWIAREARRPDGSTAVTSASDFEADSAGWTTPFALSLWNALGGFEPERRSATAWLLAAKGKADKPAPNNPIGHDVTLVGWPWVEGTHSWVEPTAISLLALAPSVPSSHPRMVEGVRVLLDRAISTGGWNLGNPVVFGQTLRPLPGPTGLALLALNRAARESPPRSIIEPAIAYLAGVVEQTFAPTSLGWATLGLRAWGVRPSSAAQDRLAAATDRAVARNASASELAMLLLAVGDRSLQVLGITPLVESEATR